MIDISEKLKKLRKSKNLTIQAVCDGSGIVSRTYQNYEYGKREISAEALCKLADFYGVTTDSLLGRESAIELDIIELVAKAADFTELEKDFFSMYISFDREERTAFLSRMARSIKESIEKESKS